MQFSRVIGRFISLLDIALILLGVFMIVLIQSTVSRNTQNFTLNQPRVIDQLNFVYMYAGWEGEQNGKCYLLNEKMEISRSLNDASKEEVKTLLESRRNDSQKTDVLMLFFDDEGWFSSWADDKKIQELETRWGMKITPVYNVSVKLKGK